MYVFLDIFFILLNIFNTLYKYNLFLTVWCVSRSSSLFLRNKPDDVRF